MEVLRKHWVNRKTTISLDCKWGRTASRLELNSQEHPSNAIVLVFYLRKISLLEEPSSFQVWSNKKSLLKWYWNKYTIWEGRKGQDFQVYRLTDTRLKINESIFEVVLPLGRRKYLLFHRLWKQLAHMITRVGGYIKINNFSTDILMLSYFGIKIIFEIVEDPDLENLFWVRINIWMFRQFISWQS